MPIRTPTLAREAFPAPARRGRAPAAAAGALALLAAGGPALAGVGATERIGLLPLFMQSLDVFTLLLVAGSFAAVALIVKCFMEIRAAKILPPASVRRLEELAAAGRHGELRAFVQTDESFPSLVLRAGLAEGDLGRDAARDAAEMEASVQSARWFRLVEPLGVIGNLGPLIGLAGTVWGMIIAFVALGEAGGDAGPEALSAGIAKALFHTLLGLLLAIPCLLTFGHFRAAADRLCTAGTQIAARLLERIPLDAPARDPHGRTARGPRAQP